MNDANRIDSVIQHMAAHCDGTLTLDELAAHANLSATHFSYLFKLKTGFAPIDYFLRMKMQKACRLLDMTDLAINEIASRLGFGDPYYFSRAFRKIMQMSPSEYRMVKKG
jgi:transcriptional regulator GlxA family with amidase domain